MHSRIVSGLVVWVTFNSAPLCSTLAQPPPGYTLVFDEEFNGALSLSNWGERPARWMAHTPYAGDFGDAYFTGYNEPKTPSPFKVSNGMLSITAYRDPNANNHWRSGLLASVDTQGRGFSQALGYYEARMQLPAGPGLWPAFWLAGLGCFKTPKIRVAEVDILEEYGVDPRIAHQNVHVWNPDGSQYSGTGNSTACEGMTTGFHTYGALIETDYIHFTLMRWKNGKLRLRRKRRSRSMLWWILPWEGVGRFIRLRIHRTYMSLISGYTLRPSAAAPFLVRPKYGFGA